MKSTPYPQNIKPMLATLTDKAFDSTEWVFEFKFDGYRVVSKKFKNEVQLSSRNFLSFNELFPQITKDLLKLKHNAVLDGEAVVLDEEGIPSFQLLQNYKKTGKGNIVYYVFDILWFEKQNVENKTLLERKDILRSVIKETDSLQYSEHIVKEGEKLFSLTQKKNFEGIIAKKADSQYHENFRTKEWLKIKTEKRQEAVICGYTEPRNSRKHFGALILGVYEKKKLRYIGHTGSGFNEERLNELYKKLQKHITTASPFENKISVNNPVTWVKPRLVCEIKFSNWTNDGHMRHPVYMGLREDKSPAEVVKEA
ncbi:non-homologous end-joining DNA ligase [soil metagenome]